jgi:Protein of unknown function (DUF3140)
VAGAKQKVAPIDPESDEAAEVRNDFNRLVNMTAKRLSDWLETDQSKAVGAKSGGESVGHASGRRIVAILRKSQREHTAADLGHMKKVVGYIKRHLAQRPDKAPAELADSKWAHSLRNWGHDPLP